MLSLSILLLVAALIACIVSMMGKCPLYVSVLLVIVWALIQVIPR
jgi:hypothetical protein